MNINSNINVLSLSKWPNTPSSTELSDPQKFHEKTLEETLQASPLQTTAAQRLYNITELMTAILVFSFKGLDQRKIVEQLITIKKFSHQSRDIVNRLLTTSEEYGVTAQHAWSRESVQRLFRKKTHKQEFSCKNYHNYYCLANIKKILNPRNRLSSIFQVFYIKHLSWSFFVGEYCRDRDKILLNGCNDKNNNIINNFLALLSATEKFDYIKSLDIEVSNSALFIDSSKLIDKVMGAAVKPKSLVAGSVTLSLKNNGFDLSDITALGKFLNKNISKLILENNFIDDEGLMKLAEGIQHTSISILSLNKIARGDAWLTALKNRFPPTLHTLSLENNQISNNGIDNLNQILTPNIKNISLSKNRLMSSNNSNNNEDNKIINLILKIAAEKGIRVLFLSGNFFHRDSFEPFANGISDTEIIMLNLERNGSMTKESKYKKNKNGDHAEVIASTTRNHQLYNFSSYLT